jgi:excisionase family DNA binding protein
MSLTREVLTPEEVAEYLQLTPDTIYRYIRQGKLVASRLGRQYRIPRANVELLLQVTSTAGAAPLRTFSKAEMKEWLEEDRLDGETRATAEQLVADLRKR